MEDDSKRYYYYKCKVRRAINIQYLYLLKVLKLEPSHHKLQALAILLKKPMSINGTVRANIRTYVVIRFNACVRGSTGRSTRVATSTHLFSKKNCAKRNILIPSTSALSIVGN